ncbi:hypothetical protein MIND_00395000 [Mycena indigotica]|uniref:Uncharacterized protein n=1 Tax=Mycena indigotica TaxID=2126181 RepID=A0A8H6T207_9AGAR|nr:uncharacterized protein MIND_00395000 [Mycena indigotica]KAF7310213.1 hypothetical protein MIND_00395000 [Mycena indigotica]
MAALFLHNSLWVPDPEQHTHIPSSDYGPRHSQSLSHGRTTSASTLAGFSDASHPTQPLLPASTETSSVAYLDLLARQPRHPSVRGAGPPPGLSFDGDPMTGRERKEMAEHGIRRRLQREKRAVVGAEGVLGVWTLYCTTRYFLAYGHIPASAPAAESAALALAAASLAALALLFSTALLPLIETHLLGRCTPTVRAVRRGLRYFAAALLLAPAVANLVLALVWRRAGSASLELSVRCKLDVDVVWSVQEKKECAPPPWVHWLILALLRLVLTAAVLIVYVVALAAYGHTRRPSADSSAASHRSLPSASSTLRNGPSALLTPAPERRSLRRTRDRSASRSQSQSQSQSHSNSHSRSRSRSRHHGSAHTTISYSSSSSASSSSSSEGEDDFDPYADLPLAPALAPDRELNSFVLGRDTAAGSLLPSTSSSAASPYAPYALTYSFPPFPPPGASRQHPDRVLILNAYVRRMPTIESLGSREVGSGSSVPGTPTATASLASEQGHCGAGGRRPSVSVGLTSRPGSVQGPGTPVTPHARPLMPGRALGEAEREVFEGLRRGSTTSSTTSSLSGTGSSSFFSAGTGSGVGMSVVGEAIVEEPAEMDMSVAVGSVRPLPRPPVGRSSTA